MKKFSEIWTNDWKPDYSKFQYSGWALLDKVTAQDQILDIGCGYNLFKEKLGDQTYGIDPYNSHADELVSWQDYKPHKNFTKFFVLGSINFFDEEYVESQIQKLSDSAHTGSIVYWRQNPGTGPHSLNTTDVPFYPWTFERNQFFAKKYNFTIAELKQDTGDRIYAEWRKN